MSDQSTVVERICADLNTFDPLDEEIRATLRAQAAQIAKLQEENASLRRTLEMGRPIEKAPQVSPGRLSHPN